MKRYTLSLARGYKVEVSAENEEDAKKQFEVSANEVIEKLRKIESELNKTKE